MSSRPQSQRDPGGQPAPEDRDEEAVRAYIENLALTLTEIGFQRTAARVFAALTVTDSGRMTAAELSERLSISPAAVSGAVRYLHQIGMVAKERMPGERRDHYRIYDDLWYASFLKRDRVLRMWRDATTDGVRTLGENTPAGRRLAGMADFLDFMVKEIPVLFDRWQQQQPSRDTDPPRSGTAQL